MKETIKDIFTMPNAVTAARLALSPRQAWKLYKDPRGQWPKAAAFIASDVIDGKLASLGGLHPWLARLGFRRSEIGRKLDPLTDKIVIPEMLVAGMAAKVVPKSLGALALAQKAAISLHVSKRTAEGRDTYVTNLGRYSELATNFGFGGFFIAESIDDPDRKQLTRNVAAVVTLAGIAGAITADIGYAKQ